MVINSIDDYMKMNIWIDIGTHSGQEYNSIFGSNFIFYIKVIKNLLLKKIVNFKEIINLINLRNKIKNKRNEFFIIFVEANYKIILKKKVYNEAEMIFNFALTDNKNQNSFNLIKLYFLRNQNQISQGSSIYKNKANINEKDYILTHGVSVDSFMQSIKKELDKRFLDYNIILRLNCEGVEDSVIYSAYKYFNKDLKIISGSLKDVKYIKGENVYKNLEQFMKDKNIINTVFTPNTNSWFETFKEFNKLI